VLVLLHGLASNHTRWSEFIEHTSLVGHLDILAPDLRGHGASLVRQNITMETWAHDLAEILKKEGYKRVVLVGHSLGAHVALFFARLYPDMVRGLILIDPLSDEGFTWPMKMFRWLRYIGLFFVLCIRLLNRLGIHRHHLPERDLQVLDEEVRELIRVGKKEEMIRYYSSPWPDLIHNPTANYLQYILEVLRPLPRITNIEVSTLLLLSSGSKFNLAADHHTLTDHFSHCTVKTIRANHWLLTEKPVEARQAIEHWYQHEFGHHSE